jgi:hypothetical protein
LAKDEGRPVELADAALLNAGLNAASRDLSDCAFSNLFLFRHVHRYRIFDAPLPHVRGFAYDGAELVIPLFELDRVSEAELEDVLADARWLYPFGQNAVVGLRDRFDASWNEADSDYVYTGEQFRSFQGMKKRRQQLVNFETEFAARVTVRPLADARTIASAEEVLSVWQTESEASWAETDFGACSEALSFREQLGLFGLLVEVSGEPAGFMLASALSERMAAVHFAKGLRRFSGVYQFMFRAFAQEYSSFELLNFEQDLGKPRFRQAKQSYRPVYLARKYRLRLKE